MSFNIWNNLDEIGLFLGLTRLDSETNESFFNRIKAFGRWKYKTDYLTQVHSLPIQLGLKTESVVKITSDHKYECTIDWEYFYIKNEEESIRVYINEDDTLDKILTALTASTTFEYKIYDESSRNIPLRSIVRNKNVKIGKDYIDDPRFNLGSKDIIPGSVKAKEGHILITEKQSIADLKKTGDYFVDYESGYMEIFYPNFRSATIFYKYYDPVFYIESTELNLRPVNLEFKYGITNDNVKLIPHLLDKNTWG